MSLSLGEKLRQAREAKGVSISEVAEQTRISALYLESIENNDYRNLPGGIFNKGFVKSFAKFVGLDEKEALEDYAKLVSEQQEPEQSETRPYRPEVLTDDRSGGSFLPNLIFAAIILALLTAGVLYGLKYYQDSQSKPVASNTSTTNSTSGQNSSVNSGSQTASTNTATSSNTNTADAGNTALANTAPPVPTSDAGIAVQLKSLTEEASVMSTTDGKKATDTILPDAPRNYTAEESLTLRYSKYQAQNLQLVVNGKQITLPAAPANPKMQGIEFEINKANLQQILQSGAITLAAPAPANAAQPNTNTATPAAPPANTTVNAAPR